MGQQLLHVAGRGGLQLLEDLVGDRSARAGEEGLVEQAERLGLRFTGVGLEGLLAELGIDPAGSDGDQLLMQPRRGWAVQAKAPEEHDAGDRVRCLGQAGSGQVVMDEALGGEAAEQALHDAMLQVKMDDLVVHLARVFEDHGSDRRRAPPFPGLLVARTGDAEGVHRVGPGGVGTFAAVERGEERSGRPVLLAVGFAGLSGSAPISSRAQEMAERKWSLSRPMFFWDSARRSRRRSIWAVRAFWRSRVASSSSSTACALVGVEIGRLDLVLEGVDLVAADTGAEGLGEPGVDDLCQAAELFLDRLGLAHEGGENSIFRALLVYEVVAEDHVFGLELAVDPAVALLHAAGVPGHVEMEEIPAVGLEV